MFCKKIKNILIVDRYNWLQIDYAAVGKILGAGYRFYFAEFETFSGQVTGRADAVDPNYLLKHIKYELCVDLGIYPEQLVLTDELVMRRALFWSARAQACSEYFSTLFDKTDFRKVIIIQGHQYESSIARCLCNERNINICCLENTFDKNRFLYDFISGVTVNRGIAKNVYYKYVDFVDSEDAESYCWGYREKIRTVKSSQHQTGAQEIAKGQRKRIVFLGQVYTDASVLFGINNFTDPVDILEQLVDYAIENDYELLIKLHPKELDGTNTLGEPYQSITLRKIQQNKRLFEKIQKHGVCVDYKDLDTYRLISTSDVCVTINSQSGFESLIFGAELVLCGRAFYSGLGLTYEAHDRTDLVYCLDRVLKEGTGRNNLRMSYDMFYIVTNNYFLEKNAANFAEIFKK